LMVVVKAGKLEIRRVAPMVDQMDEMTAALMAVVLVGLMVDTTADTKVVKLAELMVVKMVDWMVDLMVA